MIPLLFGNGGSAPDWVIWAIKLILVAILSVWTFFLAEAWWSTTHGFLAYFGTAIIAILGVVVDLKILFWE